MPKKPSKAASHFDTLFGVQQGEQLAGGFKLIARDKIERGLQPRRSFPATEISELAASISALHARGEGIEGTGILQPLLAIAKDDGYRLIAGERRYRASEQAGVEQLPVIVMAANDSGILLAQLVENLQRRDLPPLEEAHGIAQLMDEQELSLREAARMLGKGKGYIENRVNLLKMRPDVQEMVSVQTDTLLHARDIEAVLDPALRSSLIRAVLEDGISRTELRRQIEANQQSRQQQDQLGDQQQNNSTDSETGESTGGNTSPTESGSAETELSVRTDSSDSTESSPSSQHPPSDSSPGGDTQSSHTQDRGTQSSHTENNDTQNSDIQSDVITVNQAFVNQALTSSTDPLIAALRPAVALATEFGRQIETQKMTRNYRQQIVKELESLRHEIAMIERKLENKLDS